MVYTGIQREGSPGLRPRIAGPQMSVVVRRRYHQNGGVVDGGIGGIGNRGVVDFWPSKSGGKVVLGCTILAIGSFGGGAPSLELELES